jgi:uncharacterized protein (DUF952 family)
MLREILNHLNQSKTWWRIEQTIEFEPHEIDDVKRYIKSTEKKQIGVREAKWKLIE